MIKEKYNAILFKSSTGKYYCEEDITIEYPDVNNSEELDYYTRRVTLIDYLSNHKNMITVIINDDRLGWPFLYLPHSIQS